MIEKYSYGEYVIVYNGQIYNTKELKETLIKNNFAFKGHCDTEVLLKSYIYYGNDVVHHLNGIFAFAIWNSRKKELFIARDHFGVKPLFYTIKNGSIIFGSEIKALFEYPGVEKVLDNQGICELFGIGPAHTPGTTIFKDIYELKPAHCATFNSYGLHIERYWKLKSEKHTDSFGTTCQKVKFLLNDAITRQLVSDVPLCTFLSGGLDSSIITKFASDYCKANGLPPLDTYSIDYVDNDKNFVKSDFQPNSDNYYINLMNRDLHTNHHQIVIDTPELAEYLEDAMVARDMPGMADIDSSLLLFCKNVKKEMTVSLTGECADEIFGGYPWFYKEHLINHDGFPWALSENLRKNILNSDIIDDNELLEYINEARKSTLKHVSFIDGSDDYEKRFKSINYLTVKWFMSTLVERTDRTSMANSLEVRVPFADHRIFEYVYNLPARMKLGINNSNSLVEKYLLRKAFEDELPKEVVYRKKSPFPKTYDPIYLSLVEKRLLDILSNKKLKVHKIINSKFMLELINSHGNSLKENWFGQLMTYPQTLAYIIQISDWLEEYKIEIAI